MRIVCISDTHEQHTSIEEIPECDLLIHAGDITGRGSLTRLKDFNFWLGTLTQCKNKVVIAGNHDFCFERPPDRHYARGYMTNCIYLEDSGIEIGGLKIWGSPQSPWFWDWAFGPHRGEPIRKFWRLIPKDTDILISHGPPLGYGDRVWVDRSVRELGPRVGCKDLLKTVEEIKPRLHVFGHIHEDPGTWDHLWGDNWETCKLTTFVNASTCDGDYRPVNKPIVIDL